MTDSATDYLELAKRGVWWVLTCLVFWGMPLLLMRETIGNQFDLNREKAYEAAFARLEQTVYSIPETRNTETYLQKRLEEAFKNFIEGTSPTELRDKLNREFPGLFHIYFFDGNGNLIREASETSAPARILNIAYSAAISDRTRENISMPGKLEWERVKAFLGEEVELQKFLDGFGKVFQARRSAERMWLYYRFQLNGGLLVQIDQIENFSIMGLQKQLERRNQDPHDIYMQIGLSHKRNLFLKRPVETALEKFASEPQARQVVQDELVYIYQLEKENYIWATFPANMVYDSSNQRLIIDLILLLLFFVLSIAAYYQMIVNPDNYFSIRWRLIAVFSYAGLLPLMVLFGFSQRHLAETEKRLLRDHHEEIFRSLKGVDSGFNRYRTELQNSILRSLDVLQNAQEIDFAVHLPQIASLAKALDPESFVVFNTSGKLLYNLKEHSKAKGIQNLKTSGKIAETMLARLNKKSGSPKMILQQELLESLGGFDVIEFLIGRLNEIAELRSGERSASSFFYPVKNASGEYFCLLAIHWRQHALEKKYLNERIKKFASQRGNFQLYAANLEMGWQLPDDQIMQTLLKPFLSVLEMGKPLIDARIPAASDSLLITGIRTSQLGETSLIASVSDKPLKKKILTLQRQIYFLGFGCLLISIFLSNMLARRFLKPIGLLSDAISAVSRREFATRVSVPKGDEFSNLADLFNSMAENLAELNLAAEVQSRLFPTRPLTAGDYSVYGRAIFASELGGDYFDYLCFDDRFIFVITGDVTGHGTPAALAMAMARAIVCEGVRVNANWQDTIRAFNNIFYQNFDRDLIMTAVVCCYNFVEHTGVVMSFGHPFPLRLGREGLEVLNRAKNPPLGIRSGIRINSSEISLEPGDRLVFYTDGMLECIPAGPEESQNEKFQQFIQTFEPETNCEWVESVMECHRSKFIHGRQTDDLTVVSLVRRDQSS